MKFYLFFHWRWNFSVSLNCCVCLRQGKLRRCCLRRTASSFCTLGIFVRILYFIFFYFIPITFSFAVKIFPKFFRQFIRFIASKFPVLLHCKRSCSHLESKYSSSEFEFFDKSIQCFDCQFVYHFELQKAWNAKTSPKYSSKYSLMKSNKFLRRSKWIGDDVVKTLSHYVRPCMCLCWNAASLYSRSNAHRMILCDVNAASNSDITLFLCDVSVSISRLTFFKSITSRLVRQLLWPI